MSTIKGNQDIRIIQGDSYQRNVILENATPESIEGIYISCKALSFTKQLVYDDIDDKYVFHLAAEETEQFKPTDTHYDMTIYFVDKNVKTLSYKARFVILPKINVVSR